MSPIKVVHFAPGGERQAGDIVINPGETETIQVGAETATIACSNDNQQGKIAFNPRRVWVNFLEAIRHVAGENEGMIETRAGENYLVRPSASNLRPEDEKNNVVVHAEVYHT